jgi:hypothetical protein
MPDVFLDFLPDPGPMEDSYFSHDARDLILKVFVTASKTLDDEWKRYVKSFEEYISEPRADESEVEIACVKKGMGRRTGIGSESKGSAHWRWTGSCLRLRELFRAPRGI